MKMNLLTATDRKKKNNNKKRDKNIKKRTETSSTK